MSCARTQTWMCTSSPTARARWSPLAWPTASPQKRHISVDDEALQVYKPDRRTYDYVRTLTGMEHTPNKVWLVSSNMFDLVGASNAGLNTVRVDRSGNLPRDGLRGCLNLPRKRY